jgi:hypothetical protein
MARGGQVLLLLLLFLWLQDNLIRGRFLAELTREVFTDLEASKYQHAEMRISIYGRKQVRCTVAGAGCPVMGH